MVVTTVVFTMLGDDGSGRVALANFFGSTVTCVTASTDSTMSSGTSSSKLPMMIRVSSNPMSTCTRIAIPKAEPFAAPS